MASPFIICHMSMMSKWRCIKSSVTNRCFCYLSRHLLVTELYFNYFYFRPLLSHSIYELTSSLKL